MKKFLAMVLSVALCFGLCVPAAAANEEGVTYTAIFDNAEVTASSNSQDIVLTVEMNKEMAFCSLDYNIVCPDDVIVKTYGHESIAFSAVQAGNNVVSWASATAEDITSSNIAILTFTLPADMPAGEYTFTLEEISLSNEYGMNVWEDGASVSATLTVLCPHNDTELINVVAPSCKDDGYTGDLYCNDCEKIIEEGETDPATGDHVDTDGKWESNDAQHFHTCGCGEKFDNADHVYNKSVAEEQYLASEATCTAKATYYKSCVCGKAGTETFESGKVLPHTYDQEVATEEFLKSEATCTAKAVYYKSCVCGAKSRETFEYGEKLDHTYDQEVATEEFLKSEATCTAKAVYYKSCVCGEASDTETFEYGNLAKHVYDQEVATEEFLKSEATCTAKAVYYKSCICGEVGTKTFTYGETTPHVYDQEVVAKKYLKSEGTCVDEAVYYKSCVCGAASETETFETELDPDNHVSDGSKMEYDETQHWGTCECGAQIEPENHKGGKATCIAAPICSVCGQSYGEADPDAHKWDKGVVTVEPTEEAEGLKIFTCELCKLTKEQILPKKNPVSDITPSNPEGVEPVEPTEPAKPEVSFGDIAGEWFEADVKYVAEKGLMNGVGDGSMFAPLMDTSRGMIVTILWRMEGQPVPKAPAAFTDVENSAYYAQAVAWASENGIVNGYGATFGPNDNITREQFATILFRYAQFKGYDVSVGEDTNILSYADVFAVSEYAVPAMQWACGAGLINGIGDTLQPAGAASRAQAAAILHRFCENVAK